LKAIEKLLDKSRNDEYFPFADLLRWESVRQ
jgi:hypothetical protein